ncbi:hypothetical protein ACVWZ6_004619 [Bradyrhizobium sp. GM6.1]
MRRARRNQPDCHKHRLPGVKQEISHGLGPATQHLLSLVDSAPFREFVSAITGVRDLISDPTQKFAGVHRMPPGGFTKIHRDFEVQSTTRLFNRLNLLIDLNRDWPEAYGGSLELWPAEMSALGRRIFPQFNTMILWETHGATLHGLPDPGHMPAWSNAPFCRIVLLHDDAPRPGAGRTPRPVLGRSSRRRPLHGANELAGSSPRPHARSAL